MNEDYKNKLYRIVAEEISSNNVDQGLWLRALVESQNDQELTKGHYAKLRVEELSRKIDKNLNDEVESKEHKIKLQREIKESLKNNERNLVNK